MLPAIRCLGLLTAISLLLPGVLFAQSEQVLRDAWGATSTDIFDLEDLQDAKSSGQSFQAIAFEGLDLANQGQERNVIAVSGQRILRYINGTTLDPNLSPAGEIRNARTEDGFRTVTTVAVVTDGENEGNILYNGFNRRKRRFELLEYDIDTGNVSEPVNGSPQLLDSVYVEAAAFDQADADYFRSGGLLAASSREVLWFPGSGYTAPAGYSGFQTLVDVRDLGERGSTQILSTDLIRGTDFLVVVLSNRKVIVWDITAGSPVSETSIPVPASNAGAQCADGRSQLLRLRNRGVAEDTEVIINALPDINDPTGTFGVNVISDRCGQVLDHYYQFVDTSGQQPVDTSANWFPQSSILSTGDDEYIALAVGEGNQVTCFANEPTCTLTSGYTAAINFAPEDAQSELLVLKVEGLCDPRVPAQASICFDYNFYTDTAGDYDSHYGIYGITPGSGVLVLNDLLPENLEQALAANEVVITIPNYMFSAAPDAEFGAVFVEADDASRDALIDAWLDIDTLLRFDGLGVRTLNPADPITNPALVPGEEDIYAVLNSDVVAYAPDNPLYPTVRNFEATPVTVGEGSVYIRKRGYSVDIFGLMHDVYEPVDGSSGRVQPDGGITSALLNENGNLPSCRLEYGNQVFEPVANGDLDYLDGYFLNLVACLFADIELLLDPDLDFMPDEDSGPNATDDDPRPAALTDADRLQLSQSLDQVKDKIIKALNAARPSPGPNAGETTFQSTLVQLGQFESALANTTFINDGKIYKNDLTVRTEVLRFNLLERADVLIPR